MRRFIAFAVISVLVIFLVGCGGGGSGSNAGYTISVKMEVDSYSTSGKKTTLEQSFEWNPVKRVLSRKTDEMGDLKSAKKVEEAGYTVSSGDFVTGPTQLTWSGGGQKMTYVFTPSRSDVTKGYVAIYSSMKPFADYGEYRLSEWDFPADFSPLVSVINDTSPDTAKRVGLLSITGYEGEHVYSSFLSGAYRSLMEFNKSVDEEEQISFVTVDIEQGGTDEENSRRAKNAIEQLVKEHDVDAIISGLMANTQAAAYAVEMNIPYYDAGFAFSSTSQGATHFVLPPIDGKEAAGIAFTALNLKAEQVIAFDGHGYNKNLIQTALDKTQTVSGTAADIEVKYLSDPRSGWSNEFRIDDKIRRILSVDRGVHTVVLGFESNTSDGSSFISTFVDKLSSSAPPIVLLSGAPSKELPGWWFSKRKIFSMSDYAEEIEDNPVIDFVKFHKNHYNDMPTLGMILGYEAGIMISHILNGLGAPDSEKIVAATIKDSFPSATGTLKFQENHIGDKLYAVIEHKSNDSSELFGLVTINGDMVD